MFGVPAESVSELVQDLDMLKMSWEGDTKPRHKSDSEHDSTDQKAISDGANTSNQNPSASTLTNNSNNSKREIYHKFISQIQNALSNLSKEMNKRAKEQTIQYKELSEKNLLDATDDEGLFTAVDTHCRELEEVTNSMCNSNHLADAGESGHKIGDSEKEANEEVNGEVPNDEVMDQSKVFVDAKSEIKELNTSLGKVEFFYRFVIIFIFQAFFFLWN